MIISSVACLIVGRRSFEVCVADFLKHDLRIWMQSCCTRFAPSNMQACPGSCHKKTHDNIHSPQILLINFCVL